jgi:hypothetical protein
MLLACRVEKPDVSASLTCLEAALKVLPRPEHTGALTSKGGAVPLYRNECSCFLHQLHVALHGAIKLAKRRGRSG